VSGLARARSLRAFGLARLRLRPAARALDRSYCHIRYAGYEVEDVALPDISADRLADLVADRAAVGMLGRARCPFQFDIRRSADGFRKSVLHSLIGPAVPTARVVDDRLDQVRWSMNNLCASRVGASTKVNVLYCRNGADLDAAAVTEHNRAHQPRDNPARRTGERIDPPLTPGPIGVHISAHSADASIADSSSRGRLGIPRTSRALIDLRAAEYACRSSSAPAGSGTG